MEFDTFDDVVLFEMSSEDTAEWLWLRLQHTRGAWLHEAEATFFVAAVLRDDPADLALLLREVEAWLTETALLQLSFELDGRSYLLIAEPAPVAVAVD